MTADWQFSRISTFPCGSLDTCQHGRFESCINDKLAVWPLGRIDGWLLNFCLAACLRFRFTDLPVGRFAAWPLSRQVNRLLGSLAA